MKEKILKFHCLYINPKIDQDLFDNCLVRSVKQNKLFEYDEKNDRYYSISRFEAKAQFIFSPRVVAIDENFNDKIVDLIMKSHELAITVKTAYPLESNDCSMQHDGELDALVYSAIKKIHYENIGILDFISYITFKIVTKQIWKNANKRTAIISAANLFKVFGLYVVFRNNQENYLAYWHRFVISIAKRYENVKQSLDKKDNEEKILKDIKNRFLSSLYLDISSIN